MEVNQVKRIKKLEAELAQYKKNVPVQTLHITVLKDVVEKRL
jgi:putative transposase